MSIRKSLVAVVLGVAMIGSIPVSASAITGTTSGSKTWTYDSLKRVAVKDTASDSHRAEGRIQRTATQTGTTWYVRATGGSGSTKYSGAGAGYNSGKIIRLKSCHLNNNPLDSDACSAWKY